MKKLSLLFLLGLPCLALGEEPKNPEIQKIDARLEELKTIWRQETDIINGYTKNKTVPVREGSKEYYACVQAANRIKQAEAEAAKLKAKRKEIDGTSTPSAAKDGAANDEGEIKFSPYDPRAVRDFDFEATKAKSEAFKEKTLVFKGLYLGMPAADALGILNHSMGLPQAPAEVITVTAPDLEGGAVGMFQQLQVKQVVRGLAADKATQEQLKSSPYRIFKQKERTFISRTGILLFERPIASVDGGSVSEFELSQAARNLLFDAAAIPTEEFLQTFIDSYDIPELEPSQATIQFFDEDAGIQHFLQHRSPKGFEITYWQKPVFFDDENGEKEMLSSFSPAETITIKKIKTEEERKKKFD